MASAIKAAMVHPNFLHSNSTTHTTVFSAIAELIDNACDTDVCARDLWVDEETINNMKCLTFLDNGCGMTYDKLHKMLSFGFNEKEDHMKQKAIGQYGNGFKSGSMRLGHDALVITRCLHAMSVGFLSQTYLKDIGAEVVLVPIVTWDITPRGLTRKNTPENKCSIEVVLQFSPFKSEEELKGQLEEELGENKPGTKIIIFNLKKDNAGDLELDFESDKNDIRNPETAAMDETVIYNRDRKIQATSPEYKRSLRKYCTILYLKPRMRIFLRNVKVKTKWIEKSLRRRETDVYNPQWANQRLGVKLTFGFTKDKSTNAPYGMMLYNRNRLITAYEKIGCQNKATGEGKGVICVVEANFLEPIHNKQEFKDTSKYRAFVNNAAQKLKEYYEEKTRRKYSGAGTSPETEDPWNWIQCDNCMSWRRLPEGYDADPADKWVCYMNPDPHYNRCEVPEETEGEDEEIVTLKPSYMKTVKKEKAEKKKLAKFEEERKTREHAEALEVLKKIEAEGKAARKATRGGIEDAVMKLTEAQQKQIEEKETREHAEALEVLKKMEAEGEAARKATRGGIEDAVMKLTEAQQKQIETQEQIKAIERQEKNLEYINPEISAEEKAKSYECFRQGKYEEAFKHYQEALKKNPNDAELLNCNTECHKKMRELAQCDDRLSLDPSLMKLSAVNSLEVFGPVPNGEATKNLHTSQNVTGIRTQVGPSPQIEQISLIDFSRKRKSIDTVTCDSNQRPAKRPVRRNISAEMGISDNTGSAEQPSLTRSISCSSSTFVSPSTDGVNPTSGITCSYVPPGTAGTSLTSGTSSLFVTSGTDGTCLTSSTSSLFVTSDKDGANSSPDSMVSNSIQGRSRSVSGSVHPADNPSNDLAETLEPTSSFETNTKTLPIPLDSSMISVSTATESKADDTIKPEKPDREDMQNLVTEGIKIEDQMEEQHGVEGLLIGMDKDLKETSEKKVFLDKEAQTDTALLNGTHPQEVEQLKSSILEERQAQCQKSEELEKMKKAFDSFKSNVFTLLEKIDPGKDHGTEDNIDTYLANTIQRARNNGNEK